LAVRIRLRRIGSKKKPYYRIVVADARTSRNGKFIEVIGHYDPRNKADIVFDLKKAEDWQTKGAQFSNTVKCLYKKLKRQQETEKEKPKKTKNSADKPKKEE